MSKIVCFVPTYSPVDEAVRNGISTRPFTRLPQNEILARLQNSHGRDKPWMYMDAIDSIKNVRPDIQLVVADAKSTESIRAGLSSHHMQAGGYILEFYNDRQSQWKLFNDVYKAHEDCDYFVYSSSDVIWPADWVAEATKEFEKNPKLQILFPLVSCGDGNIPCQVAKGPRDEDPIPPPYDPHGKAPVLNAYVMIFRMDFLRAYGGYPNVFRNCFTESFLAYMCQAIGGEMRLLPRGWCWHWSLGDKWEENGSHYYFNQEHALFQTIINSVQMAQGAGTLTKEVLRKKLYKA